MIYSYLLGQVWAGFLKEHIAARCLQISLTLFSNEIKVIPVRMSVSEILFFKSDLKDCFSERPAKFSICFLQ